MSKRSELSKLTISQLEAKKQYYDYMADHYYVSASWHVGTKSYWEFSDKILECDKKARAISRELSRRRKEQRNHAGLIE